MESPDIPLNTPPSDLMFLSLVEPMHFFGPISVVEISIFLGKLLSPLPTPGKVSLGAYFVCFPRFSGAVKQPVLLDLLNVLAAVVTEDSSLLVNVPIVLYESCFLLID
jgi:hypothetical protein